MLARADQGGCRSGESGCRPQRCSRGRRASAAPSPRGPGDRSRSTPTQASSSTPTGSRRAGARKPRRERAPARRRPHRAQRGEARRQRRAARPRRRAGLSGAVPRPRLRALQPRRGTEVELGRRARPRDRGRDRACARRLGACCEHGWWSRCLAVAARLTQSASRTRRFPGENLRRRRAPTVRQRRARETRTGAQLARESGSLADTTAGDPHVVR